MSNTNSKKTILTGDRSTGKLHIGHLLGSLQNRVRLQEEYNQFILIANVQALSDNFDNPQKVKNSIVELLKDYYAVGIDFEKSHIVIQSEVPQIHEMFVYFSNFVSVQQVAQNPTVKQEMKTKEGFEKSTPLGFFFYPIHQVADILSVRADLVPVGKDQLPMIEETRDIAQKFDATYNSNIFNLPEALLGVERNVPGIDGNEKMGKSLNNAIYLSDSEEELRKKVFSVYTDPTRVRATDIGHIEGNVAFTYHDLFNSNLDEVQDLKDRYTKGQVGDVEVKEKLFQAMNEYLTPIREKRNEAESKVDQLLNLTMEGTKVAKNRASETLDMMKEVMMIKF
ncbi:tryptophan--tRNA ligase [bacterium]|nr:MAG: tryptophan--tRNA ligase [bacterium]